MVSFPSTELQLERVDDLPLVFGLLQRLRFAEHIDAVWPRHPLWAGVSLGTLTLLWLTYLLTAGDHIKSHVQDWVAHHQATLELLLPGHAIRPAEFSDERLTQTLHRFAQTPAWERLEERLADDCVTILPALVSPMVRLDSTTSAGYHTVRPDGLMQYGLSKDHRPDLPQLKCMLATWDPVGLPLATSLHAGQVNDDRLYRPLMARVRALHPQTPHLFVGDCKMAAFATRADCVAHGDTYLVALPRTCETAQTWEAWITAGGAATTPLQAIYAPDPSHAAPRLLGHGYEQRRTHTDPQTGHRWDERVLIVRSVTFTQQENEDLTQRLARATTALRALTKPPGHNIRAWREEPALAAAVAKLLAQHRVTGLLQVAWAWEGDATKGRYRLTAVTPDDAAIAQARARLGWRIYATSVPAPDLPLPEAVRQYRAGWTLESQFHVLKGKPLGLRPLAVHRTDQLLGLVRLLTLALRGLTVLQTQVRLALAAAPDPAARRLAGLYPGQPARTTDAPTAAQLLTALAHQEITRLVLPTPTGLGQAVLTPLPALLVVLLAALELPATLYTQLGHPLAEVPGRRA